MMTYLAIYFAIGILFTATLGVEEGSSFGAAAIGFLWPLALLWWLIMVVLNLGR